MFLENHTFKSLHKLTLELDYHYTTTIVRGQWVSADFLRSFQSWLAAILLCDCFPWVLMRRLLHTWSMWPLDVFLTSFILYNGFPHHFVWRDTQLWYRSWEVLNPSIYWQLFSLCDSPLWPCEQVAHHCWCFLPLPSVTVLCSTSLSAENSTLLITPDIRLEMVTKLPNMELLKKTFESHKYYGRWWCRCWRESNTHCSPNYKIISFLSYLWGGLLGWIDVVAFTVWVMNCMVLNKAACVQN